MIGSMPSSAGPACRCHDRDERDSPDATVRVQPGTAGRCPVKTDPGRKPEYSEDRRWEGGKTCKQMTTAERAAEKDTGLDVPLAS
jgi:hypothetical protein